MPSDSSGNCRDASFTTAASLTKNSPSALATDTNGSVKRTSGAVTLALGSGESLPSGTAARTYEAWFTTTATVEQALVINGSWFSTAQRGFGVYVNGPNSVYVLADGTGYSANPGYAVNDGNWHQIDATYDGTSIALYLDGTLLNTWTVAINTTANRGLFFGDDDWGHNFAGGLDEVAVYPTALNGTQIGSHYLAAVPKFAYIGGVGFGGGTWCAACERAWRGNAGQPIDTQSGN